MKKILFTGAFALLGIASFSQTSKISSTTSPAAETAGKDKGARQDLMNELNLTDDQKTKFRETTKAGKDARTAIENDKSLSEDQKKEKLKTLRETQNSKFKAFLTPEQYSKFEASKKANKEDKNQ